VLQLGFFFISLPSKKRSKETAPEIAASILTKAGSRAQNKAGVLLSSLLLALFRRSYSKGWYFQHILIFVFSANSAVKKSKKRFFLRRYIVDLVSPLKLVISIPIW